MEVFRNEREGNWYWDVGYEYVLADESMTNGLYKDVLHVPELKERLLFVIHYLHSLGVNCAVVFKNGARFLGRDGELLGNLPF